MCCHLRSGAVPSACRWVVMAGEAAELTEMSGSKEGLMAVLVKHSVQGVPAGELAVREASEAQLAMAVGSDPVGALEVQVEKWGVGGTAGRRHTFVCRLP